MADKKTYALLCPTRGRPTRAINMALSAHMTADDSSRIEVLYYVDDDDPEKTAYQGSLEKLLLAADGIGRVDFLIGERISVSWMWTLLARQSKADVFLMQNDDVMFRSNGWDRRLDEETSKFPDDIYCMWFDDGFQGKNPCAFPIVSRRWVETLGYFSPGIFEFLFNDTWIVDIGRRVGRLHYIDDIYVEHLHFLAGKAEFDQTYKDNYGHIDPKVHYHQGKAGRDYEIYQRSAHYREADAQLLRAIMTERE